MSPPVYMYKEFPRGKFTEENDNS